MSFSFTPSGVSLARPSDLIAVYRYDVLGGYEYLPNIFCVGVQWREGADPGSARFRYDFGDPQDPSAPQRFEDVYPLNVPESPYVVQNDDRIVVKRFTAAGETEILFDGFAQIPQADLDAETETVTFVALGTPIREWDTPLGGAWIRDADTPVTADADTETTLPARFNPNGLPNATPAPDLMVPEPDPDQEEVDFDDAAEDEEDNDPTTEQGWGISAADSIGDNGIPTPTFLGPISPSNQLVLNPGGGGVTVYTLRYWQLGMAVRYVLATGNPEELYVEFQSVDLLDTFLTAVTPALPGGTVDISDGSTYSYDPIVVQDYDITGEAWPVALQRLIEPYGFMFRFVLSADSNDDPLWTVQFYRKDYPSTIQSLYLQAAGSNLDPGQTNVGALHLARDSHEIVNAYAMASAPVRVEASFVLAPGFTPLLADLANLPFFIEGNPDFYNNANNDAYRLFIFDECGEGHWNFNTEAKDYTVGDLGPVLNPDELPIRPFAHRRRPGRRTLISEDVDGKPLKATLHVSSDYLGPQPGVWDGATGNWEEVDSSEWQLLPDRLGIRITCQDPNGFNIGKKPVGTTTAYHGSPKLSLVDWIANPTALAVPQSTSADNPDAWPKFRLTCVIEADVDLAVASPRTAASPTGYEIIRLIDGRDRFRKTVVSRFSAAAPQGNMGPNGVDLVVDEDTAEAQAVADGMRRAHELGVFAGSVTLPRLSTGYAIGDSIDQVYGRNVSLQSNAASEAGASPIYPMVVAISHDLDGRQQTTLELSDRRGEPPPKYREHRDRADD